MNSSETMNDEPRYANYQMIIPLSLMGVLIGLLVACFILILIVRTKRLHTVTHLLISNGAIASIIYSLIQSVNYIFLAFIPDHNDDLSCRLRAYFGYFSVVGIVYSYLAQAISRLLVSTYSARFRWASALKTHQCLIFLQWTIVIVLPAPAILTKDISFRPSFLCWVPKKYTLHVAYTALAYYLIPASFIFIIYIWIYIRAKRRHSTIFIAQPTRRTNRDLEVLYTIIILFVIYTIGAIPTLLYFLTNVHVLYEIGIVSVSITVAVEKLATVFLDRDLRRHIRFCLSRSATQVRPTNGRI